MSDDLTRLLEQARVILSTEWWDEGDYGAIRETLAGLADAVDGLYRERDDLHDWFECERCDHNIHHREPHGDRECEVEPGEGVEFCTFLICGRCSNQAGDKARARVAALEAELEAAQLARIEAQNPGIDMERVKRERAERRALLDGTETAS